MEEKDYTLVFCRRKTQQGNEILLGMKKRGFGVGKWNGFGGKLEQGESVLEAAVRELQEESGLVAKSLKTTGYLVFKMVDDEKIMRVHVFTTWDFEGEPMETEEMRPAWYSECSLPFDSMWADDPYWMPYLIDEKQFLGRFTYEDDIITDYTLSQT